MTKFSGRRNLGTPGLIFAHGSKSQSIMVARAGYKKREVAGHIPSKTEKHGERERERCMLLSSAFFPLTQSGIAVRVTLTLHGVWVVTPQ